jgi:hypothetical protein
MAYFVLSLTEDGDFKAELADARHTVPDETAKVLDRYKSVFTALKAGGSFDEGRKQYAHKLFSEARNALEQDSGSVDTENLKTLKEAEGWDLGSRYGSAAVDDKLVLHLYKAPWLVGGKFPEEVWAFVSRVDRMVDKVRWLLMDSPRLQSYRTQLASIARFGLEEGDIKSAVAALDLVAEQFVNEEGPSIRQKFVSTTLNWACGIAVFAFCLFGVLNLPSVKSIIDNVLPSEVGWENASLTTLCLVLGVCLGVTFFAFARNLNMTFESLGHFDPAALSAPLRFMLVGTVTALACLFMGLGLLEIKIGGVNLAEFAKFPTVAILVGVICGYADVTITGMLTNVLDTVKREGTKT